MVYTEMWGTFSGFHHNLLFKNHFYSEGVSSGELLVDISSLDISLGKLLEPKTAEVN